MRKYYDEIEQIAGNVVMVEATGIGYDELAVISNGDSSSLAQVIRINADHISLQAGFDSFFYLPYLNIGVLKRRSGRHGNRHSSGGQSPPT